MVVIELVSVNVVVWGCMVGEGGGGRVVRRTEFVYATGSEKTPPTARREARRRVLRCFMIDMILSYSFLRGGMSLIYALSWEAICRSFVLTSVLLKTWPNDVE